MELRRGMQVWIPCEVKPGPFSNERMVRVSGEGREWLSFVQCHLLRDAVEEGETHLLATIDGIEGDQCVIMLPGENLGSRYFRGSLAMVTPVDPVEA